MRVKTLGIRARQITVHRVYGAKLTIGNILLPLSKKWKSYKGVGLTLLNKAAGPIAIQIGGALPLIISAQVY